MNRLETGESRPPNEAVERTAVGARLSHSRSSQAAAIAHFFRWAVLSTRGPEPFIERET